jgi:hypothetical protein
VSNSWSYSQYGKITNVPNHQPAYVLYNNRGKQSFIAKNDGKVYVACGHGNSSSKQLGVD